MNTTDYLKTVIPGKQRNSNMYILLFVGIVSAFGPFVTDFYLPALPELGDYFHTSASLVQLSLTCSMVGLAVGQLIVGPLSDRYGRKLPLAYSLVLFCFSTIGCLFSSGIYAFIFFRLLQGISGAGGVVISRSIATDLYEGQELARFFSMLSSVQGLTPVCAPILGGFLLEITDWQGIFGVLLLVGVLLLLVLCFFKETLSPDKRQTGSIAATFKHYQPVLLNRPFMRYVWVQAFAMGVMFSYIAASPFIFQGHFGLSPLAYSLCFGVNALAIMAGSLTISRLGSLHRVLRLGTIGFLIIGIAVALMLVLVSSVWVVEGALFLLLFFLGLILPSSTTLALDMERDSSGYASALLGFLMFLVGGIFSPLTGIGNMLYPTALIILVCCIGTWLCARSAFLSK